MKTATIFLLSILLSVSRAAAIPVITGVSGTLAHGSTVTINGIGFGTKPVAAPLKYDDFETGTNGAIVGNGWSVDCSGTGYPAADCRPDYSSRQVRTNSTMSARARFWGGKTLNATDGMWESSIWLTATPNMNHVYFDAWVYYWITPQVANAISGNHKLFRMHANTYSPNLYYNIYCGDGQGSHLSQDGSGEVGLYHRYFDTPNFRNNWRHIQAYFEMSSANQNDGTALFWVDNHQYVFDRNAWNTTPNGTSFWNQFYIGNFSQIPCDAGSLCLGCGTTRDTIYTYWDNAYLDTTQAHVEIGNGPTYVSNTASEIQTVSSWTNGAIDIKLNQGAYSDFAGKYVYVTDRSGAVNFTGFPLTGGGPPSTCSSGGGGGGPPPNVQHIQTPVPAVLGTVTTGQKAIQTPVVAGDYLFVCTANGVSGGPRTVSGVTDNLGNTYSQAGTGFSWGTTRRNEIWYTRVTNPGQCVVTVTMSGSTDLSFTVSEYSGLAASLVVDTFGGSSSGSTTCSVVLNTANQADLVIGVLSQGEGQTTLVAGSGYTELAKSELAVNMPIITEAQVFNVTGNKVVDVALGAARTSGIYAVAFKAAP